MTIKTHPILTILAAGSLKSVLPHLLTEWESHFTCSIECHYGPAGLLREQIEAGLPYDLFLSANERHPQRLLEQQYAIATLPFCRNQLCLTLAATHDHHQNWLEILQNSDITLATSTPHCDPSGDYAWAFFEQLKVHSPQLSEQLKQRAKMLVGGIEPTPIPSNEIAATWLISTQQAQVFLGYAHYRAQIDANPHMVYKTIPTEWNSPITYVAAINSVQGKYIAESLLSSITQTHFQAHGFLPISPFNSITG